MAKKLIHNYTFDPTTRLVTIHGAILTVNRLLIITNTTANEIIYVFNDTAKGGRITYNADRTDTEVTLTYNVTAMSATDTLQVFVELDSQTVEAAEPYIDAASKMRVSQPENLIDTDFEYGLQTSKWETLELTKNIPTFYSRDGDQSLDIEDITTTSDSDTVLVETATAHGLGRGAPLLVAGSTTATADGGYLVASVVSSTVFSYHAKAAQNITGSIKTTNTHVFKASIYSGTEFKVRNVNGIVSDGASPSVLTVSTEYPTDFEVGTKLAITNSLSSTSVSFDTTTAIANNAVTQRAIQVTVGTDSASSYDNPNALNVRTYQVEPIDDRSISFRNDQVTISGGNLRFNPDPGRNAAGASPNQYRRTFSFYYNVPAGKPTIGGLNRGGLYVGVYQHDGSIRIWSGETGRNFFANPTGNSDIGRITITSVPTGNDYKHQFWGGWITSRSDVRGFFASDTTAVAQTWNHNITPFNMARRGTNPSELRGPGNGRHFIASEDPTTSSVAGGGKFTLGTGSVGNLEQLTMGSNKVFHTESLPGLNYHYPSVNGLSRMALVTGDNDDIHVPVQAPSNRNTFYKPNHGLTTGDVAIYTLLNGTGPGGLTSGATYRVVRVSASEFSLMGLDGVDVILTSTGSLGAVLSFAVYVNVPNLSTVDVPGNTLEEGDAVVYETGANNSAIGGLADGATYYVARKSGSRIAFASNPALFTGASVTLDASIIDSNNIFDYSGHGFTTGRAVDYIHPSGTAIGLLQKGLLYFVRVTSRITFTLHRTAQDAVTNVRPVILRAGTGTATFRESYVINLISKLSGQRHTLRSTGVGAADGTYTVATVAENQRSFTLSSGQSISGRSLATTVSGSFVAPLNAFYYKDHGLANGTDIRFTTTSTHITGLTSGTTYYAIPLDQDTFQLASSVANAESKTALTLTENATSRGLINTEITFQGSSVVASAPMVGFITAGAGSHTLVGTLTSFDSLFKPGDKIRIAVHSGDVVAQVNTGPANTTANTIALNARTYSNGDAFHFTGSNLPDPHLGGGRIEGVFYQKTIYFLGNVTNTSASVHYTHRDAVAGTNKINITGATPAHTVGAYTINPLNHASEIIEKTVDYVSSNTRLMVKEAFTSAFNDFRNKYFATTRLLLHPDGGAAHRPHDGGAELVPSSNPDGQIIRQTRKYFKHQAGKGLQVSFAVSFSPTTQCDELYYDSTGALTIKTRNPHRLTAGVVISISGATGSNAVRFNTPGSTTRTIATVVDAYTAKCAPLSFVAGVNSEGSPEFYVTAWANSHLKCGLFDDQNGFFFDFDGSELFANARSSTKQLSGHCQVNFRSGQVVGTNTRFATQLIKGAMVVLKGNSYQVTKIDGDRLMFISPSYRGVSAANVVASITRTTRVAQENWSLDKCDGTGPTGFLLDINKIQTAYIDYASNAAGKVRFGFKNQHGKVHYVHEFAYGNFEGEAHMRSPNIPVRYEVQNVGRPTYTPALAHWGTSVIMDGSVSTDRAYVYSASGNTISVQDSAVRTVPLLSVRLAPSVDNATGGALGERELINRMQLILDQVAVSTTHAAEVSLVLNGRLPTNGWTPADGSSSAEVVQHGSNDVVTGGTSIFSFRASGDNGTTRTQQLTTQDIKGVAALGNSILGGDQLYPDGPDVVTVVARLVEDASSVGLSTPFKVDGRLSWSESQA